MARSVAETLAYIGPMCLEMSKMAREAKLDVLAHLLEIASLEAVNKEIEIFDAEKK